MRIDAEKAIQLGYLDFSGNPWSEFPWVALDVAKSMFGYYAPGSFEMKKYITWCQEYCTDSFGYGFKHVSTNFSEQPFVDEFGFIFNNESDVIHFKLVWK